MTSSLLRFAGAAALALTAVCAVGAWPTWMAAGSDGLVSMGLAAGVSWIGSLVGWMPLGRLTAASEPQARVYAILSGLGIRLGATLALVAGLLVAEVVPHRVAFVAWTAISYGVLLVIETQLALRFTGRSGPGGIHAA